jgi:PKD repeat protein
MPGGGWYEGPGIIDPSGIFSPAGLNTSGSYTITYYYQLPFTDCIGSDTFRVFVRPLPVPDFSVTDSLCINVAAIYENTTVGGDTYLWHFDDGNSYTQISPSHAFGSTGDHDVRLYATSLYGCVDSTLRTVYVSGPPEASFEKDTSQGCAVLPVTFTNTTIGYQFVRYVWNFGNQESSNQEQPPTVFYSQGLEDTLYYVQLLATNHCGNDLATDSVLVYPKPLARPFFSQIIGCTPLAISFNNLSRGLPDTYAWYIDGQLYSTDSIPPANIFRAEGVDNEYYDVLFIATNECGTDSVLQTITVLPDSIRPFFSIPVNFGCEPFTLFFNNTTAPDSNIIYNWFFGNGDTSTEEDPTYTFYATGDTATLYQVTLVADNGCSVNSMTVPITVYPIPPVSFDVSPVGCARDTVFFTNTSTDAAGFIWDFGDGAMSEMTNATHVFDLGGWYNVTLTGYGIGTGCPGTYTDSVFVRQIPTAAFDVDSTFGCPPHTAYFTNQSQGALYYRWYFGDGNQTVGASPGSHVYNQTGFYSITLTAIDEYACEHDTSFSFVQVYPTPSPDFSISLDRPCGVPVTVCFEDTGIGAFAYSWNFGNGEMSTDTDPCTDYPVAGDYQIEMRVRNEFLCENLYTDTITIYEEPIADFAVDNDTGCAIEPLLLFNNSLFADDASWYFSDGYTSSDWVPERLLDTGTYSVMLVVGNPSGCTDTLIRDPLIRVYPSPVAAFEYEELEDELPTTFAFTDTSSPDAITFGWNFDDGSSSTEQNPVHRFLSSFDKLVAHWVTNSYGCPDTAYLLIDLDTLGGLYIPNIFEPDDESEPEKNIFQPKGIGLREFHIAVYARNGQLMWESSSLTDEGMPDEFWNGTYQGKPVPAGVYIWRVHLARYFNGRYWKGMLDDRGNLSRSGFLYLVR